MSTTVPIETLMRILWFSGGVLLGLLLPHIWFYLLIAAVLYIAVRLLIRYRHSGGHPQRAPGLRSNDIHYQPWE